MFRRIQRKFNNARIRRRWKEEKEQQRERYKQEIEIYIGTPVSLVLFAMRKVEELSGSSLNREELSQAFLVPTLRALRREEFAHSTEKSSCLDFSLKLRDTLNFISREAGLGVYAYAIGGRFGPKTERTVGQGVLEYANHHWVLVAEREMHSVELSERRDSFLLDGTLKQFSQSRAFSPEQRRFLDSCDYLLLDTIVEEDRKVADIFYEHNYIAGQPPNYFST